MGLLNQVRQEEEPMPDETIAPGAETIAPEAEPIAPEAETPAQKAGTQPEYEKVVVAALTILHGKKSRSEIERALKKSASQPEEALAAVTTNIVTQIDKASGDKIPEDVILPAAGEILGLVAELADASGAFTADKAMINRAMILMTMRLMKHYGVGQKEWQEFAQSIPPEMQKQIAAELSAQAPKGAEEPAQAPAVDPMAAEQEGVV